LHLCCRIFYITQIYFYFAVVKAVASDYLPHVEVQVSKMDSRPIDPPEIVYRLKRAGWTVTRLAKEAKVSRVTATLSISSGSSPKVRAKVSEILGIPEQELWPFRFN
jgi:lambda repressor-like predicted transcriptional regulator